MQSGSCPGSLALGPSTLAQNHLPGSSGDCLVSPAPCLSQADPGLESLMK